MKRPADTRTPSPRRLNLELPFAHRSKLINGLMCMFCFIVLLEIFQPGTMLPISLQSSGAKPISTKTIAVPQVKHSTTAPTRSPALCPAWDPDFSLDYESTCADWKGRIQEWAKNVKVKGLQPVQYTCAHESTCHGIGDRLSGIHTILEYAIKFHRPLRILWKDLDEVFEPTCLLPETWEPQDTDKYSFWCKQPKDHFTISNCDIFKKPCLKRGYGMQVYNQIRACPNSESCAPMRKDLLSFTSMSPKSLEISRQVWNNLKDAEEKKKLAEIYPSESSTDATVAHPRIPPSMLDTPLESATQHNPDELTAHEFEHMRGTGFEQHKRPIGFRSGTAAHVFGCALRSLFQVTTEFKQLRVAWIHDRKSKVMTIAQVQELMNDYFTISIHFRMGDASFSNDPFDVGKHFERFEPAFKCANSVGRYAEDVGINHGKPVRWVFSSDSPSLRAHVLEKYGDKVMMLDETPKHVARSSATAHTMAEWYLLSLGDRLVLNRLGHFGDVFEGRLSGFAKTFWAFQLKHLYYDAGDCRLRPFTFGGSWHPMTSNCRLLTKELKAWKLPQPHRAYGNWKPLSGHALQTDETLATTAYNSEVLFGNNVAKTDGLRVSGNSVNFDDRGENEVSIEIEEGERSEDVDVDGNDDDNDDDDGEEKEEGGTDEDGDDN